MAVFLVPSGAATGGIGDSGRYAGPARLATRMVHDPDRHPSLAWGQAWWFSRSLVDSGIGRYAAV